MPPTKTNMSSCPLFFDKGRDSTIHSTIMSITADSTTTAIPSIMTAVVLTGHGGFEKLELKHDWPVPPPKQNEVLIHVKACGMNNTDINTRIGWYSDNVTGDTTSAGKDGFVESTVDEEQDGGGWGNCGIQFPRIQGADVGGHVVAVGDEVPTSDWMGKRVMTDNWLRFDKTNPMNRSAAGYLRSECDGGFAQYVALPVSNLAIIQNDSWSDAELATMSCSYATAEGMLTRARVVESDVVLVTGGSGGVGSALIQLAKRRGATVIALTTSVKKDQVLAIGADAVICRDQDKWVDVIRAACNSDKVTVAADLVGGPVFEQLMQVLGRGGRYVTSGAIGGKHVTLDISHLYLNDWELIGSTVNTLDVFPNLVRYIEGNEIRPLLAATYPLEQIKEAQTAFLAKNHVGKMVLVPPQP